MNWSASPIISLVSSKVLKNSCVPLSLLNPQQWQANNHQKSISSNSIPKMLKQNHHHITYPTLLNPLILTYEKILCLNPKTIGQCKKKWPTLLLVITPTKDAQNQAEGFERSSQIQQVINIYLLFSTNQVKAMTFRGTLDSYKMLAPLNIHDLRRNSCLP